MGTRATYKKGRKVMWGRPCRVLLTSDGIGVSVHCTWARVGSPRKTSVICKEVHEWKVEAGHPNLDVRYDNSVSLWIVYLRCKAIGKEIKPSDSWRLRVSSAEHPLGAVVWSPTRSGDELEGPNSSGSNEKLAYIVNEAMSCADGMRRALCSKGALVLV